MSLRSVAQLALHGFLMVIIFVCSVADVYAGFGITPPYVRNTSLTRNSIYEQQIMLVRADPNTDMVGTIRIDAPDIADWVTVLEGEEVALPRGVQKVPITVRVQVPRDAEFTDYEGVIRITTLPADRNVAGGSVNISLGARVDIDLSVIDREIREFRVRRISVSDLNEGSKLGWLFFPGKIRFAMLLENTGNVDIAPSRVEFKIYDTTGNVLLEETENLGGIDEIEPYATEEVIAEIPTRLPAGQYIARYRIFNDEEVRQEGDLSLTILPAGTLQTAGFGFMGLSLSHKISVLLPLFALIIGILYAVYYYRQRPRRRELE